MGSTQSRVKCSLQHGALELLQVKVNVKVKLVNVTICYLSPDQQVASRADACIAAAEEFTCLGLVASSIDTPSYIQRNINRSSTFLE
jgi:hypothetical protein